MDKSIQDNVVPLSKRTAANRRNAQMSTGPRTEEGKSRSRRNAVKHGILAPHSTSPRETVRRIPPSSMNCWAAFIETLLPLVRLKRCWLRR